jgi:hypothetical protein
MIDIRVTHSIGKSNSRNSYYASVFGCERNIPQNKTKSLGVPFKVNIKMIKKPLAAIRRNKRSIETMRPSPLPGSTSGKNFDRH